MPTYIRRVERNVRAAVKWYDDARRKNNGVEKIIGVWMPKRTNPRRTAVLEFATPIVYIGQCVQKNRPG